MNAKHSEGASLIEVLVSITVLGLLVFHVAAGLALSHRMNARAEALLQTQIKLSSCLEVLRAEQIHDREVAEDQTYPAPVGFGEVQVKILSSAENHKWYEVSVSDPSCPDVSLRTKIGGTP